MAFSRLVDNLQHDERALKELAAHGLLQNTQQLVRNCRRTPSSNW